MAGRLEAQLIIAGAVSNSMLESVNKSGKALSSIGNFANEAQKKLNALAKADRNQISLKTQIDKLAVAKSKLKSAEEALQNASGKSAAQQDKLTQKHAAAQINVSALEKKVKSLTERNKQYVNEVRASYGPLQRMRSEQDKLRTSAERLNKIQERGAALERRRQKQRNSMSNARAGMVDAMALAYAARGPINAMLEAEMSSFYLSTVLNSKDQKTAMQKSYEVARSIAKSGIAGYNEAMDIQYALNSAGFTAALASAATPVIAAVSKITKGTSSEVGEIIATTYNNLGNQMQGNMEQKLTRIGELFTKTQFKFQIRDFGQLGESFKYAAAPIMSANANLEQSFTILGKLNDAGLQGGIAGTAFSAMMRQVIKGSKDYQAEIAYAADGTMDIIGTLRNIKKDMQGMDAATGFRFLNSIGGDEGARALAPLLKDLDGLTAAYEEVKAGSKGIIDKNIAKYLETNTAKIEAMKGSLTLASQALGGAFSPAIQTVASLLSSAAVKFGMFAEKHPALVKLFGTILAGAVATKLMYSGFAYFFGMFRGGFTNILIFWNGLQKMRLAMSGLRAGFGAGSGAIGMISKMFKVATSAGIKFAIANAVWLVPLIALIGVGYLIYRNWDKIKNLWSSFEKQCPRLAAVLKGAIGIIIKTVTGLYEMFKKAFEWGKKLLGLGDGGTTPTAAAIAGKSRVIPKGRKLPKHGKGGIFTSPEVAIIGDKPEMLVPLQDRLRAGSILNSAGFTTQGSESTITFSPTYVINGNADENTMRKTAKLSFNEFKDYLKKYQNDNQRVSLA